MYHNVGPLPPEDPFCLTVAPDQFERQMGWLVARGYETIWPSDWLAWRREGKALPRKAIMLTFDDGYAEMAEYAFPVVCRYRLKAAVYVVTRRLGLTNTWDEANGHRTMRLVTADQVRQWAGNGIEFGSHTRTHPSLAALSEERLTEEIEGSRDDLQSLLGTEVLSFAYPYAEGADNSVVREHLRRTYQLALTVCEGLNFLETNPYELRRVAILPSDSVMDFERKVRFGTTLAPVRTRDRLAWAIRAAGRAGRRALRRWRA